VIRHIVLFKWSQDASDEQKQATLDSLSGLQQTVPGVVGLHVGANNSGRGTYDFGLTCDFASQDDLRGYIEHPDHKAAMAAYISKYVQPGPEVLDFDYSEA
jgi:hypothetical protein